MKIVILIDKLNELKDKGVKNVVIEDGNFNEFVIYDIVGENKMGVIWIESEEEDEND